ncbi:uncharacterized protein [Rutidosis leptorrhynchoides]|uniref:uncharacterized protein n=1 Tax=Rutidosis leptorrhynchoides TaxID=125765 RepID=UPI003A992F48
MCLTCSRTSSLVNGSPTREFDLRSGLRQGDLLSLFLFLIIMEGFNLDIKKAVELNIIKGASVGGDNINISHLLYADDAVIVSEWNQEEMVNIIRIFNIFFLASGLKINISKSNVYGINVSDEEMAGMVSHSGCCSGSFPFTYLGIPLGSNMNLIANWKPLIDKFKKRLSFWQARMLSYGGRLTLIKSVLGSIDKFVDGNWKWIWNRDCIGGRNEEYLANLVNLLPNIQFTDEHDGYSWAIDNSNEYSVFSTRNFIDNQILITDNIKTRWVKELPIKINIPLWRIARDRLPNRVNLHQRGIVLQRNDCPVCNSEAETLNHLFFFCELAQDLWRKIRLWCDSNIPNFSNWNDWISWYDNWVGLNTSKCRAYCIVAAYFWIMWRFRNGVVFQDEVLNKGDLFDLIRSTSYFCYFNRSRYKINYNNWLLKPL